VLPKSVDSGVSSVTERIFVEFPGRILVEVADDEVVLDMAGICLRDSQRASCCEDLESNVVFFFFFQR